LFELPVETDSTTAAFARGTMRAAMAGTKSLSTVSQILQARRAPRMVLFGVVEEDEWN
jgi:hypothetical protein